MVICYKKVNDDNDSRRNESTSDEFAEYALNLVATNIVLLVRIYKKGSDFN